MARKLRRTTKKSTTLDKVKSFCLSTTVFPILLSLIVVSTLFVIFRMKGVEADYSLNELNVKIDKTTTLNKGLKARKARQLSISNLRKMARKHKLKSPSQKQIILISGE